MEYDGSARDMTEAECRKQERARYEANQCASEGRGILPSCDPNTTKAYATTSPVSEPHYRLSRQVAKLRDRGEHEFKLAIKLQALLDCLPNKLPPDAQDALYLLIGSLNVL